MHKKTAITGVFFILAATSAFSQQALSKETIIIDGKAVNFPCSAGGEPLVIYSSSFDNKMPISSGTPIEPIYIKPGYTAEPLTVTPMSVSNQSSTDHLIISNTNPAHSVDYTTFSIKRIDKNTFFVNSVNFASVDIPMLSPLSSGADISQFVTSFMVLTGNKDKIWAQSVTPEQTVRGTEDEGVIVGQEVKSISGRQYAWNQLGAWMKDGNYLKHEVKYNFKIVSAPDDPSIYNGFGYWVCGSDQPPVTSQASASKDLYYTDMIK